MGTVRNFDFPYIKGITFGFEAKKGDFALAETFDSIDTLIDGLNINTVILPVVAWQKSARSTALDYKSGLSAGEWETENLIDYIQKKGIRVMLEPVVNLLDGGSRDSAGFSGDDSLNASAWGEWFNSYKDFIIYTVKIAQKTGVSLFSVGCGLFKSESCEAEWRSLIDDVRRVYDGYITYNAGKYKEDRVTWWDAVDFISSSGCSSESLSEEIGRIKNISVKYNKPFALIEEGRQERGGAFARSGKRQENAAAALEQDEYYKKLFDSTKDLSWFYGYGLSKWPLQTYANAIV